MICSFSVMLGMKMEGLFRVPGPVAVMEELRDAFEEGTAGMGTLM